MPRRRKENDPDVQNQLLNAALQIFAAQGYSATTLDKVAEQVGLSKGAVYWYFDNKLALFLAVVQREFSLFTTFLTSIVARAEVNPLERVKLLMVEAIHYYSDHPEFGAIVDVLSSPEAPEIADTLQALMSEQYAQLRGLVTPVFQEAHHAGQISDSALTVAPAMLIALLEGLFAQWSVDADALPLRSLAPQMAEIFLAGLAKS